MRLNPKLTPLETNSVSLSSTYFDEIEFNSVTKASNVVEVSIRARIKANVPNNTTIMTLPYKSIFNGEIPMYLGGRWDYSGGLLWGYIGGNNGKDVRTGAITATGQFLKVQFTYITPE